MANPSTTASRVGGAGASALEQVSQILSGLYPGQQRDIAALATASLLEAVRTAAPPIQARIVSALGTRGGSPDAPAIADTLADLIKATDSPLVQSMAISALGRLRSDTPKGLQTLGELLPVRRWESEAAQALAGIGSAAAMRTLSGALERSPQLFDVVSSALAALAANSPHLHVVAPALANAMRAASTSINPAHPAMTVFWRAGWDVQRGEFLVASMPGGFR